MFLPVNFLKSTVTPGISLLHGKESSENIPERAEG
jgi:hypothetical protein